MSEMTCDAVRAMLPEWVRGALLPDVAAGVEAHLTACSACAREAVLVRALRDLRPVPSPDLEGRIQEALRGTLVPARPVPDTGRTIAPRTPWPTRRLAAAAAFVLAVGTSVIWSQIRGTAPVHSEEGRLTGPVLLDDWGENPGIVAGVPVIEELSDEELLTLLEELGG